MSFGLGARIGPYEVTASLGEGGMGEVYRATDTNLKRPVAIKVLPASVATDAERLARFQREAEVLASLNHTNIAAIYRLERSNGITAIVMELVEGSTLADRIARGPIPIDEALQVAKQIAEALEAAHEQGIIHRDLKPANIKVRTDGIVKVLDFGLAKALGPTSPSTIDATASPTITGPAMMTGVGVLLGTAAYMAPEQARGKVVDKRADIWAFGCVLYEMLTGRRAFAGDDVADVLGAVIHKEPEWKAVPAQTPEPIRRLLRRALEKDRKRRLDSAVAVRLDIDDASASTPSVRGRASVSVWRSRRAAWSGALIILAASGAAALLGVPGRTPGPGAPPVRFNVSLPAEWQLSNASLLSGATPLSLAVSPDGRRLAIVARNSDTQRIWLRSFDSVEAQPLTGTDGAELPFWSPDSQWLGFFAGGKLKKIDVSGGPAVTLADAAMTRGGSWGARGTILFAPTPSSGLFTVPEAGGSAARVTTVGEQDDGHTRPVFLPDGRHFLYRANLNAVTGPIYLGSIDSTERRELLNVDSSNVAYSREHLLFMQETTLMARPFDPVRLEFRGDAFPVAEQIYIQGLPGVGVFSTSDTGVLAYGTASGSGELGQLVWFDRGGQQLGVLADWGAYGDLELAPDGGRAAVTLRDPSRRTRDIWIFDIARRLRTRFTFDPANESSSAWSPDGTELVFSSDRGGLRNLYRKRLDGADGEELLFEDGRDKWVQSWSRDGRALLYFTGQSTESGADLFMLPLSGERKGIPLQQSPFNEQRGRFSPDGRWIAFQSNESVRPEVYVAPFPAGGGKWQVSVAGGILPRWRSDGAEIFYLAADNRLMAASVKGTGASFEVGAVTPLFEARMPAIAGYQYDVSPDGQRFLINTLPDQLPTVPITVVLDWTSK